MTNILTEEKLRQEVYNAVKEALEKTNKGKTGIAFSGGVDSSLMAKVCKEIGDVKLLTIGFDDNDISNII